LNEHVVKKLIKRLDPDDKYTTKEPLTVLHSEEPSNLDSPLDILRDSPTPITDEQLKDALQLVRPLLEDLYEKEEHCDAVISKTQQRKVLVLAAQIRVLSGTPIIPTTLHLNPDMTVAFDPVKPVCTRPKPCPLPTRSSMKMDKSPDEEPIPIPPPDGTMPEWMREQHRERLIGLDNITCARTLLNVDRLFSEDDFEYVLPSPHNQRAAIHAASRQWRRIIIYMLKEDFRRPSRFTDFYLEMFFMNIRTHLSEMERDLEDDRTLSTPEEVYRLCVNRLRNILECIIVKFHRDQDTWTNTLSKRRDDRREKFAQEDARRQQQRLNWQQSPDELNADIDCGRMMILQNVCN
jgi:hypothetical protein